MEAANGYLRIGELSRRSGVSTELLRAWERRYGLLRPTRSEGGFRLYSPQDEHRVAVMRDHLKRGLSAAQAARMTLEEADRRPDDAPALARGADGLREALDGLDETAAHAAIDRLLSNLSLETVLGDVILPYLRELGRPLGARRGVGCRRAFRQQPPPGAAPRPRPRLGSGCRSPRSPGLCAGGTARSGAHRLRPRVARARLADHLPRARYPTRLADRGRAHARARRRRDRGQHAGAHSRNRGRLPQARTNCSALDRRGGRQPEGRQDDRCPTPRRGPAGWSRSRGSSAAPVR